MNIIIATGIEIRQTINSLIEPRLHSLLHIRDQRPFLRRLSARIAIYRMILNTNHNGPKRTTHHVKTPLSLLSSSRQIITPAPFFTFLATLLLSSILLAPATWGQPIGRETDQSADTASETADEPANAASQNTESAPKTADSKSGDSKESDDSTESNDEDAAKAKEIAQQQQEQEKRQKMINNMLKTFEFGTTKQRLMALETMLSIKNEQEIAQLKPGLNMVFADKNNKLLLNKAIAVCGQLKLKEFIPEMVKYVADDNEDLSRTAMDTLAELEAREHSEIILHFLVKRDLSINDNATITAMRSLAILGYEKYGRYALNCLKNEYLDISGGSPIAYTPGQQENDQANDNAPKTVADSDLIWKKDKDQSMDPTILGQLLLSLGNMKYQESGEFLAKLLNAAFEYDEFEEDRVAGKKIDEETKTISMSLGLQGYIVNALGKMNYQAARQLLIKKVERVEGYTSDDQRKKYLILYLHCLASLVRLGETSVVDVLISSIRDDSPGVRLRVASLMSEIRSEKTIDSLVFRSIHDGNNKVRLECLKALMEIADPGSTNDGQIIGAQPSPEAKQKALQGLLEFLDEKKNPHLEYSWMQYLAKRMHDDKIEQAIVVYLEARSKTFLPRDKQISLTQTAAMLADSRLKKKGDVNGPAYTFLQQISQAKRKHRYAASEATRQLAEFNTPEKQ